MRFWMVPQAMTLDDQILNSHHALYYIRW